MKKEKRENNNKEREKGIRRLDRGVRERQEQKMCGVRKQQYMNASGITRHGE